MSSKTAQQPSEHRSRPWSLATRLAVGFATAAFALLLLMLTYSYLRLSSSFANEDRQFVQDEILEVETLLRSKPDGVAALRDHLRRESEAHLSSPLHIRVLRGLTNETLSQTSEFDSAVSSIALPPPRVGGRSDGVEVTNPLGVPLFAASDLVSVDGQSFSIQMALDRTIENRLLGRYRQHMIGVLVVSLIACALTGYIIARSGLRPIGRMTDVIARVGSSTLHERIEGQHFPAELSLLTTTFNAMLHRLEDSFARLSRFSADIAHELRTPIHNVRGIVEMTLSKPRSQEESANLLSNALEECQRITRLIDNLLFVARAENPQTQISRQPVDIFGELRKIQEFYEPAAHEAGITLTVDEPTAATTSQPVTAELDRVLFENALCNLVENAINHTPPAGRITLGARRENGSVLIDVTDTGCGIPAEHLPRVFERFHRVDPSRSKHTGGAGLGLAIVKSIAKLHGGTAAVESHPNAGSRFTLSMPATASEKSHPARDGETL